MKDKNFIFDSLIDAENICNLKIEQKELLEGIKKNKKLVVYGKRNCGKTSLIQNVIIPKYRDLHKECFVLNIDLMEIKSMQDLSERIHKGFENSFAKSFPIKKLFSSATRFLSTLKPTFEIDSVTGSSSLSIGSNLPKQKSLSIEDIFLTIREKIASEIPTLIIMDEFQDIVFVEGAQGILRNCLQYYREIPIVLLGSKRHLLSQIFAKPDAPLAQFGEDLEFQEIDYEEYTQYINDRFKQVRIQIAINESTKLQDLLLRIPESINIVCDEIQNSSLNTNKNNLKIISWEEIINSIQEVVRKRKSRYESYISHFTEKEIDVLIATQKNSPVKFPNGKDFLKKVDVSNKQVLDILRYFYDHSIVDKTKEGYRLSDPLLGFYLSWYR